MFFAHSKKYYSTSLFTVKSQGKCCYSNKAHLEIVGETNLKQYTNLFIYLLVDLLFHLYFKYMVTLHAGKLQ